MERGKVGRPTWLPASGSGRTGGTVAPLTRQELGWMCYISEGEDADGGMRKGRGSS